MAFWARVRMSSLHASLLEAQSKHVTMSIHRMTDRPVLVHYHIFKNAGCSVDASLKASFGGDWAEFEGSHPHDIQSCEQLAGFLRANEHLRAVSSHLARPPLPWSACLPIVFLRHPLLRARSVYEFTRLDPTQPFSEVARKNGFAGYIQWALRRERGSIVIRNYQVVHLSDASWRSRDILDAEAEAGDLEQACGLLTSWGIAGIVERFAESVCAFQRCYAQILPDLDLRDVHANATSTPSLSAEARIAECHDLLGKPLCEDFIAMNALDVALYKHAAGLLATHRHSS